MDTHIASHLDSLAPGTRARGHITAGRMASGRDIVIPYLVLRGARDGPCLWVNGNVHGDEINGTMSAIRFYQGLDAAAVSGSVVVTPTANPLAFDAREKHTPQDGQDLDQTFPGRAGGLVSDRLAHALFAEMRECSDLLVSLHAIGWVMQARPYGVYKLHPGGAVSEAEQLAWLACFHPALACRMSVAAAGSELPGNLAGAIDYQMLALGKPAVMVEAGCARQLQWDIVERTVGGLRCAAHRLGLLPAPVRAAARSLTRVTRRAQITCAQAGIFRALRRPGDRIAAGEALGEIVDLYGDVVERPVLDADAIVIAVRSEPVVHTGDRVLFAALEWDEVAIGDADAPAL
jgi:predicted deacylase